MSPALQASEWNGSYAADGRCYCSGTLDPELAERIVPTPLGGQALARVCERLGKGPGLNASEGRFDRVVYADAQCGHGPGLAGAADSDDVDCVGTFEPGGDDCRGRGPRWDLAAAYATTATAATPVAADIDSDVAAADAVAAVLGDDTAGSPAAVPVLAAAATVPEGRVVVIDGDRWYEAPAGTPESGPPGSRIILDGTVFLNAETAAAAERTAPAIAPRPAARESATLRERVAEPAPARRDESPEAVKARHERLLAEARERLRERRGEEGLARAPLPAPDLGAATAPVAVVPVEPVEPVEPVDSASSIPSVSSAPSVGPDDREGAANPSESTADADAASESALSDEEARHRASIEAAVGTSAAPEDDGPVASPFVEAMRLPAAARASSREFGYIDAMPLSYDFGGAGVMLEGSASMQGRFRALARVGAAVDYQELLLGGSYYLTPARAQRLTLVLTAGVETGRFELEAPDISTDLTDTGLYLAASSRFVVNERFELQAGVGYSSFFEGDPAAFGGGFFHVNRQFDIVSRFEVGDNDSFGIGVRYYY